MPFIQSQFSLVSQPFDPAVCSVRRIQVGRCWSLPEPYKMEFCVSADKNNIAEDHVVVPIFKLH